MTLRSISLFVGLVAAIAAPARAQIDVDRFTVPGPGSVNAYIVETSDGAVIIDTQRRLSLGAQLRQAAGGPIAGILVTHPHPDHVGGLAAVKTGDVPLYATRATADEMLDDTRGLLDLTRRSLGDDFPETLPRPDVLISAGDTISFGEVSFEVFTYPASEAVTMTLFYIEDEDVLFAGDLLSPDMTPFLLEKRTAAWIDQIQDLATRFPPNTRVYPGHGPTGELRDMVARQVAYLQRFRSLVRSAIEDGRLSNAEKEQIAVIMRSDFPGHDPVAAIPDLLERNMDAVAAELQGDPGAPPVATLGR